MSTKFTFGDLEAMLERKAEERRKFLEFPPEEARRRIQIRIKGPPLNACDEDPLFSTDLTGDGVLD